MRLCKQDISKPDLLQPRIGFDEYVRLFTQPGEGWK